MKKAIVVMMMLGLSVSLIASGCGQQKAESSGAAIEAAQAMETADQKVDYLIGQAKAFYGSKDFQNAIEIAQHVLQYLDKDSQAAKDLIEKAKEALAAKAKEALGEAAGNIPGLGN
ncbi:hypothetical protein ACFL38_00285 [Candidatus Omnitrophota bacterium]